MDTNGTIFSEKNDIDRLIDELKSLEDSIGLLGDEKGTDTKEKGGGSARAKKGPKEEDLLRPAPLNFLIPTGFLLLHNDLADILAVLKKGGTGGGGGAASTVTAAATTISAATDLINALKSPAGLGDILNNKEINELLAKDPSVYQIRLAGTRGYLRAYYLDLIAQLGYAYDFQSDTITPDGSVGSFIHDIMAGLTSAFGSAITSVANSLDSIEQQKELNSIPEVKEIRKKGYIAYLKAYYADLLDPFGYDMDFTTGEVVKKENVASVLQDVFQGIGAGIGSVVESMASSINNSVQNIIMESDEDVKAVRKNGYLAYLKGYYNNLLEEFGYEVDYNTGEIFKNTSFVSVMSDAGQGIGNFIGGIVEGSAKALQNVIADATLETDGDVRKVRKQGFIAYLKGYYNNLLQEFGLEVDYNTGEVTKKTSAVSIFSDAGQALGNFAGNLLGSAARGLQNIISEAVNADDPEIISVRRAGTVAYLKAYYDNLLGEYGYEIDFKTGESKEKDKSFWEKLKSSASDIGKSIGNLFSGAASSFSTGISGLLDMESLKNDPAIMATRTLGTQSFLNAYFSALESDLENHKGDLFSKSTAKSMGEAFSSSFTEYLGKMSDAVNVDINQSISNSMAASTSTIVASITKVNEFLSNINTKLILLNDINDSINNRVDEIKEVMPSYIPIPTESSPSSSIGAWDMARTGS